MVASGDSPEDTLSFNGGFGAFNGGVASGSNFSYADVGVLELTPVLSGGYLGTGSLQSVVLTWAGLCQIISRP
jgi:hypothetical protein